MPQVNQEPFIAGPDKAIYHNFAATFEEMESSDFQLIFERGKRLSFVRNAVILQQGQENNALYVVTQGTVRIERQHDDGAAELAKLGPWTVFGEMSYLDKLPVSANVIADDYATLIHIDGKDLEEFVAQVPGFAHRFYQSLAITLSRRLRATSTFV